MPFADTARECRETLDSARNADGGWGYARGRGSRLEPTALALLALSAAGARPSAEVLERWPWADGLLADPQSHEVNLTHNGQAALAAQALGVDAVAARLHDGLVGAKGLRLPQVEYIPQDNSLQGWPWIMGTFSWVEPTAWCLLAVKRRSVTHPTLRGAARIEEAERLLRDRACAGGGWNYGNSRIWDKNLAAYVPTTAIALLALAGRPRDAVVERGVALLEAHRLSEPSGYALSLALTALVRWGARSEGVADAIARQWRSGSFSGNLMTTALALYALAAGDRYDALAI